MLQIVDPYSRAALSQVKDGPLRRSDAAPINQREISMSGGQMAYLGLVIAAFSGFAVVLFVTYIRVNMK
jgi:hypothetical protein